MKSQALKNLAGMALLGFLLALAQVPAHAQDCFTLNDASYVESEDEGGSGSEDVMFQVEVSCWSYDEYLEFGEDYLPGAVIPEYTDCSCNDDQSYVAYPDWDFETYGPYEYGSSTWWTDVTWDVYVPTSATSNCTNGACCSGAENEYSYLEYYAETEGTVGVDCY